MSEKIKLKPCPFCGGKITTVLSAHNRYHVYCLSCGASTGGGDTEEEAYEKWNRRVGE